MIRPQLDHAHWRTNHGRGTYGAALRIHVTAKRDAGPDELHDTEGPRAGQESVHAREQAAKSEGGDKRTAPSLQGVHEHHERDGAHAVDGYRHALMFSRTKSLDERRRVYLSFMSAAPLLDWESLKRCSFDLDDGPFLGGPHFAANENNEYVIVSGDYPSALSQLVEVLYRLNLVRSGYDMNANPDSLSDTAIKKTPDNRVRDFISQIVRADRLNEGTLQRFVNNMILLQLVRAAYDHEVFNAKHWPKALETLDDQHVAKGVVVRSRTNTIEGRTTGGRQKCPSTSCSGWLIGVLWETGQQMHICSEGWHFEPSTNEIHVIGGGDISARCPPPPPRCC